MLLPTITARLIRPRGSHERLRRCCRNSRQVHDAVVDRQYASGPEDVEFLGVTNKDYVAMLTDDGDAVARAYSSGE